jgi:hypothetical protein
MKDKFIWRDGDLREAPISEYCRQERHYPVCQSEQCSCWCHRRRDALGRVIRVELDKLPVGNGLPAITQQHGGRAARRTPRAGSKRQPVSSIRVDRRIWATALDLAEHDGRLITIVSATRVVVADPRYHRR